MTGATCDRAMFLALPILDLDNALAFVALDYALINNDGYWNDGSDFAIYQTP